jgi:hypothetical protein
MVKICIYIYIIPLRRIVVYAAIFREGIDAFVFVVIVMTRMLNERDLLFVTSTSQVPSEALRRLSLAFPQTGHTRVGFNDLLDRH